MSFHSSLSCWMSVQVYQVPFSVRRLSNYVPSQTAVSTWRDWGGGGRRRCVVAGAWAAVGGAQRVG
eukprot:1999330-Pyramimonas_sp.AAC.1